MTTVPLTIEVDAEMARAYAQAPPEDQKAMQLLLQMYLRRIVDRPEESLADLMDRVGERAQANGMTPEILESILRGE